VYIQALHAEKKNIQINFFPGLREHTPEMHQWTNQPSGPTDQNKLMKRPPTSPFPRYKVVVAVVVVVVVVVILGSFLLAWSLDCGVFSLLRFQGGLNSGKVGNAPK
jgi:uncharacterized membrane protein YgcG